MKCKVFDLPKGVPYLTEEMINSWLEKCPGIEIKHSTFLNTGNLLLVFYFDRKDKLERLNEIDPT